MSVNSKDKVCDLRLELNGRFGRLLDVLDGRGLNSDKDGASKG